jgi:hypothetical protein
LQAKSFCTSSHRRWGAIRHESRVRGSNERGPISGPEAVGAYLATLCSDDVAREARGTNGTARSLPRVNPFAAGASSYGRGCIQLSPRFLTIVPTSVNYGCWSKMGVATFRPHGLGARYRVLVTGAGFSGAPPCCTSRERAKIVPNMVPRPPNARVKFVIGGPPCGRCRICCTEAEGLKVTCE